MLQLLKAAFRPSEPSSPYIHYHLDDHGRKRFCDESACRPANDPLLRRQPLLLPPFR